MIRIGFANPCNLIEIPLYGMRNLPKATVNEKKWKKKNEEVNIIVDSFINQSNKQKRPNKRTPYTLFEIYFSLLSFLVVLFFSFFFFVDIHNTLYKHIVYVSYVISCCYLIWLMIVIYILIDSYSRGIFVRAILLLLFR